jgi:amino acid permease
VFSVSSVVLFFGESNMGDEVDAIVTEVAAVGHLRPEELRPEDRAYLKEHALKKPLRVLDLWALAVGVVITGAYFGWNLGLKDNGPVAMLLASLIVCLLYFAWVLSLAELSVAMPFAGGPLAYGRRASGLVRRMRRGGGEDWRRARKPSPCAGTPRVSGAWR